MSWPWAVCLHCHHTSLSCHVSKVNSFVLLCRMHLWLWKKKEVGERTRRIRRQSSWGVDAEKKWWENRKEITGGKGDDEWAKKGGKKNSSIHCFTLLFLFQQELTKFGSMKFKVQPNARVCQRSRGDLPSFLISFSFIACFLCLRPSRQECLPLRLNKRDYFCEWPSVIKHTRHLAWDFLKKKIN